MHLRALRHDRLRHQPAVSGMALPAHRRAVALAAAATVAASGVGVGGAASAQAADPAATPQRIEVTTQARKRNEAAKDVPITMEVFGGRFLEEANISTVTELQYNVPGLTIQPLESGGLVSLRGVGSGSTGLGYDPSLAVHIDGIYVGTSSQALNRLFDLSTLEVLKGPQGTLYGRNATAGVINIVTRRPDAEFGGFAEFGIGSRDRKQAEAALSTPLGADTTLRLSATGAVDDGSIVNLRNGNQVGDDDYGGVRARLSSRLGTVSLDLLVQYVEDSATRAYTQVPDPRLPVPVAINSVDTAATPLGYRQTYLLGDPQAKKKDTVVGLTLQGEISDSIGWKSITGVLDFRSDSAFDVSSFGQSWFITALQERTEQLSQEFQLLINGEKTDWVLGAYYYRQKGRELRQADIDENFDGNLVVRSQDSSSTANGTAYALFADANHRLSPALRLNAGIRVNHETKDASVKDAGTGVYFPAGPLVTQDVSFDDVSGRAGLDYSPNKDTLLFGSISKGFKAGGIQPFLNPGSGALETYKPESLIAYEFGIKHALADRRGLINASVFWYDYKDIQVRITDLSSDNIRNASNARVYGLDLQADVRIAGPLGVDFSGSWLRANYKEFLTSDRQGNPLDFSHNTLPRAPEQSYAVGLNLDKLPVAGLQLSGRLEYTYRSKIYFEASNTTKPGEELSVADALGLANLNLSLTRAGAPWTVRFTARNLADKEYLDQSIFGLSYPGAERTLLLSGSYRF